MRISSTGRRSPWPEDASLRRCVQASWTITGLVALNGALLSLSIGNAFGTAVAAKPLRDRPRRFAGAVGCADCPAMLASPAWRATRYALTRCARTNAPSQLTKRAARAARLAALLGAPQAHRGLPRTGFAAALAGFAGTQPAAPPSRRAAPARGDVCGDEEHSPRVGARRRDALASA
jgi:hypothetical protein